MKKSRKQIWRIVGICILCAALIAGSIAYFGFILPAQKAHKEHMQQVQQYRDNKMAQYRAENEKYADYEVEVAFLGDSLTDLYDLAKYYPQYIT